MLTEVNPWELPNMDVVSHDGCYYTLNNRSLYAWKEFDHGLFAENVIDVDVVKKSASSFFDKFTTDCGGIDITVRYEDECSQCYNKAAHDCDYGMCGACCRGCNRH